MGRNIPKLFVITFFQSFVMAYVIERIFALERGLNVLNMQVLLMVFTIGSLLLEVPCGILADRWKKKYVLALGQFICTFEFFFCILAHGMGMFSLAYVAAALGCSLRSGTVEALLFLTLRETGDEDRYERVLGLLKFVKYGSGALAAVLGGYVADRYGLEANYWLSLFGYPISALISLTLYEPRHLKGETTSALSGHLRKAWRIFTKQRDLLFVLLFNGLLGAVLYGQVHEMTSLTYPQMGIPIHWFGYISFVMTLFGGLGGIIAGALKERIPFRPLQYIILLVSAASLFMYSLASDWRFLVWILLAITAMEAVAPLTSGYLQRRVDDSQRVTMESFSSTVLNVMSLFVGVLFGWVADTFSLFDAYAAMAYLLVVFGIISSLFQTGDHPQRTSVLDERRLTDTKKPL